MKTNILLEIIEVGRKAGLSVWMVWPLILFFVLPSVSLAQNSDGKVSATSSSGVFSSVPNGLRTFSYPNDTIAFARLKMLRSMPIDEMSPLEYEEYASLKRNSAVLELDVAEISAMSEAKDGVYSPLCASAVPVCTARGAYKYDATTNRSGAVEFGNNGRNVSCLSTTPSPAWFYFQIDQPGNLLLHLYMEHDIDFVCYGPFIAPNAETLLSQNCVSAFDDSDNDNHRPRNGDHVSFGMGDYPDGNVVDCSYDPAATEWCYIPNAQAGEWYIILITNYSRQSGEVQFDAINSGQTYTTAHTNCNIIADLSSNSPLCAGSTLEFTCNAVNGADRYDWYYLGSVPDTVPGHGTLLHTSTTDHSYTISNVSSSNSGYYALDLYSGTNGRSSRFLNYVKVIDKPSGITLSASATDICQGNSVTLTATVTGTVSEYAWSNGATTASQTVTPNATTTYTVSASNIYSGTNPLTGEAIRMACSVTAQQQITVVPTPALVISPSRVTVCAGTPVDLTATSSCNTCTVEWYGGVSATGTGSQTVTVAPSVSTEYSARVSFGNGCPATTASVMVNVAPSTVDGCNILYVSPSGYGTGVTPDSPTSLATAMEMANCSGATIKMAEGTYNLDAPLEMVSNVILEGGYFADFSTKSSTAGTTTIHRTDHNVEGGETAPRLVAIEASYASNFSLHDLTITTADAPTIGSEVLKPYNKSTMSPASYVYVPKGGFATYLVTSGCKVYDDGGASSNYSNGADGYAILVPANGGKLSVSGTFTVEGGYDDYPTIISCSKSGVEYGSALLDGQLSGSGSQSRTITNLTSTSPDGALKIRFRSDAGTNYAGMDFTITEVGSGVPNSMEIRSANMPSNNDVAATPVYTVTSGFKIYDSGGPDGSYSTNAGDGWLILQPANGGKIQITGTETVEKSADYLDIRDLSNPTVVIAGGSHGGSGTDSETYTINTTSPTGGLVLHFHSDDGTSYAGLDLTVTELDRVQPTGSEMMMGVSTYAIHLDHCSNYEIVRCQLKPGKASSGGNGTDGEQGASGDNGGNGTNGTSYSSAGSAGSGTSAGTDARDGGAGGAGGNGEFVSSATSTSTYYGFAGYVGGNAVTSDATHGIGGARGQSSDSQVSGGESVSCSDCSGQNGNPGSNGTAGISGSNGVNGVMTYGAYILPQNGTDGTNGYGGGGGGGGQGGCNAYNSSYTFSTRASGGGGGGGGQGGQGGTGGTKGYGGGSSIGIYLYNTTYLPAAIVDCYIQAGAAGVPGNGGAAGLGGSIPKSV